MPPDLPIPSQAAWTPDAIRAAIRGRPLTPKDITQRSLTKLAEKLEAKETKFFSHQGMVVEKREVEAHSIQMEAVKLVMTAAGLLNTTPMKPRQPRVTLTVDNKMGVMEIVIGDDSADEIAARQGEIIDMQAAPISQTSSLEEVPDEVLEMEYIE